MADKDLVNMIISKIDDLKDDITKSLDRHEVKVDLQTEKLNEFEVKANSVLASHETDINNLKESSAKLADKVGKLEAEKVQTLGTTSNIISRIVGSDAMTLIFRFILTAFMLLVGLKTDVVKQSSDIVFGGKSPTAISDTLKAKK